MLKADDEARLQRQNIAVVKIGIFWILVMCNMQYIFGIVSVTNSNKTTMLQTNKLLPTPVIN